MKYRTGWRIIAIVAIILAIMLYGISQEYQKGIEEILIKAEIEKQREVIEVGNIEFKFIEIQAVGLGRAGTGGLGAMPVYSNSTQQFIDLSAPDELVLTCFQLSGDDNNGHYSLTKVYKASLERTGDLLIHRDIYECKKTAFLITSPIKVHNYSTEKVVFLYDNAWMLIIISAILVILGIIAMCVIWSKI